MAKFRVPIFKTSPTKSVLIDPAATVGAVVGLNLRWEDGTLVTRDEITGADASNDDDAGGTTDGVDEGRYNLYFTDERAQDAVGATLTNAANVTLTYDDNTPSIRADLTDVSVAAGGALKKYGFDAKGRLAQSDDATTDDLTEGSTNLYFTDARAQSAAVDNAITLGVTNKAPSEDAVAKALANVAAGVPQGPQGPQGVPGEPGAAGQIRYTGHGMPPTVILGSVPGDTYCDLDTGEIYKLT